MNKNPNDGDFATPADAVEFMNHLIDAGVAPPNLRRVVIDLAVDEIPKVYYETYACSKVLQVNVITMMHDADSIYADDLESQPPKTSNRCGHCGHPRGNHRGNCCIRGCNCTVYMPE